MRLIKINYSFLDILNCIAKCILAGFVCDTHTKYIVILPMYHRTIMIIKIIYVIVLVQLKLSSLTALNIKTFYLELIAVKRLYPKTLFFRRV